MAHLLDARGERRSSFVDFTENGRAGDWFVDEEKGDVWLMMPYKFEFDEIYSSPTRWPYKEPLSNGACWKYNGNPDSPTLSPSLNWVDVWHGYLKDGEMKHV